MQMANIGGDSSLTLAAPAKDAYQPLTEDELDQLTGFLRSTRGTAGNMEQLDGYFSALVCSHDGATPFSIDEVVAISGFRGSGVYHRLLFRHLKGIAAELRRTLTMDDVYLPVLIEGCRESHYGVEWAKGFWQGVQGHPVAWRELMEDPEYRYLLGPAMALTRPSNADLVDLSQRIAHWTRNEIVLQMIVNLTYIYRYLSWRRGAAAEACCGSLESYLFAGRPANWRVEH